MLQFIFTLNIKKQKMCYEILLLLFGTALARILVKSCNSDADCIEQHTCHDNICKKCLKCNLLFREGNLCVVDFNDCGQCLDGYEEISVTDFSVASKPCKLIKNKEKLEKCTESSCPKDNYCYKELCVKCFDCSLFNRLHPVEKCARSLSECGLCKNGYSEVAVTAGTNVKLCELSTLVICQTPLNEIFLSCIGSACLVILLFIAVMFRVFLKQQKERSLKKTTCHFSINPSAPPLYTMDPPQHIETHKMEPHSETVKVCKEEIQQARVFKQPNAAYYYYGDNENLVELTKNIKGIIPTLRVPTASISFGEISHTEQSTCNRVDSNINESMVDFPTQHTIGVNIGSYSSNIESVDLSVADESQIGEVSVTEEIDAITVQSSHEGET